MAAEIESGRASGDRRGVKFLALAFIAGLVSVCGFEPLGLWPLTLGAFAFLLWLINRAGSLRSALALGWCFGAGNFMLGLNWIATAFTFQAKMPASLGWAAVFLLSLYLAVYPAMAAGLAWRHGRGRPLRLVLLFAAAWIVTEWLRATMFTGFAWNPVGVALIDAGGLAGAAKLVGTYGLSGIAMLAAGVLFLALRREWKPAAALAAPLLLAALLLMPGDAPAPRGVPIRIVQPNIGQEDKYLEGYNEEVLRRLGAFSARSGTAPRLLLWPEAAVTRPLENALTFPEYRVETARLRGEIGAMVGPGDLLLTGGVSWRSQSGLEIDSATNSVFAMDRDGSILGRYDKAHLVPYGEYLPMRPILSAIGLSRLAPGEKDFDSGPGPRTLDLPLVGKVGFQLCYEIIFSGEVVERGNRPNFLFNPSNDAWFGAWGPPQHLAQARLRALEEGLPVLRSTPTGISALIDAEGRLLRSLPWRTAGYIDARMPAANAPTPFAQAGNFLPFLFALLLAGLGLVSGGLRSRRKGANALI